MDRQAYLKPARFGQMDKRRMEDSKNLKAKRSMRRTMNFNARRNIEDVVQEVSENLPPEPKKDKVIDRKLALQKFKAEREAQKKALREKKKPPFVVGIPHHGFSPLLRDTDNEQRIKSTQEPNYEVRNKRVTRATTRTLQGNLKKNSKLCGQQGQRVIKAPSPIKVFPFTESKTVFSFPQHKVIESAKKLTSPQTPIVLKRSVQKKPLKNVTNSTVKVQKNLLSHESAEILAAPLSTTEVDENGDNDQEDMDGLETHKTEALTSKLVLPQHKVTASAKKCTSPHTPTVLKRSVQKKQLQDVKKSTLKVGVNLQSSNEADEMLATPVPKSSESKNNKNLEGTGQTYETETPTVKLESDHSLENENTLNEETLEVESIKAEQQPDMDCDDHSVESESQVPHENNIAPIMSGIPEDKESEVTFQYGRLEAETQKLLALADQWQAISLCEKLPQEVADEIDSVVGQTRLLTNDKFKQFHGLILQFENKSGTHPVSLDDLNGFWDMMYLQVESLFKKYTTLESLKSNNWVQPEPPKKKKRVAKKAKPFNTSEKEKGSYTTINQSYKHSPRVSEDQNPDKCTTDKKSVVASIKNTRRSRSNSPAPYIAMRFSGICRSVGRTPNINVNTSGRDGTPKSILVDTSEPKIATGNSMKIESPGSQKKKVLFRPNVEETVVETAGMTDEDTSPEFIPRRSLRLKSPKPLCTSINCTSNEPAKESGTKRIRRSRRRITFSPGEHSLKVNTVESLLSGGVKTPVEEKEHNSKLSSSNVKFSLRPSILTVIENNNVGAIPKKTKKRSRASVFVVPVNENMKHDSNELMDEEGAKLRRSTRKSRKVTFESSTEENSRMKLPVTPYRK